VKVDLREAKPDLIASGSTAQKNADERIHQSLRASLPGTVPQLHRGMIPVPGSATFSTTKAISRVRFHTDHRRVRQGAAAVRFAHVEPADGGQPDRHRFQRQGRDVVEPRRIDCQPRSSTGKSISGNDGRDPVAEPGCCSCPIETDPRRVPRRRVREQRTTSRSISTPLPRVRGASRLGRKFNGGLGQPAVGNDGAADTVKNTEGSVTYLAWSFAQTHNLNVASIITSAGPDPVKISPESVGKTISTAWFIKRGDDLALDTISFYRPNQPGAYPIVLATYDNRVLEVSGSKCRHGRPGFPCRVLSVQVRTV